MKIFTLSLFVLFFSEYSFSQINDSIRIAEKWHLKSQDYQQKYALKRSIICLDSALKYKSDNYVYLHERGLLKSDLNDYVGALCDLNESLAMIKDEELRLKIYCDRALVYQKMGEDKAACIDWINAGEYGEAFLIMYCTD